ncbi:MAG: hypothetical protein A2315_08365 [Ignavibacteria bacterium RIFOXYB2_FULL_35_12]|nr:MAG: hypothetical protein A2058_08475 [Ignavibacteria bacterium GWA2_36_19]OGU53733.1 MAG: hypothetical protein A2006_13010 [Ignavibacteria bacterium GWC2_35_8]OGU59891.1 MAG: hypothetical protein A2X60_14360 [Ignavibacteria bacterium GWF2_35_20]OGU82178.1 MAG: hypothetical protein A2254_01920 [Ignavibacteria bacterium RIFOXYA2_FULL_35_9]OGU89290.1 MAG: hypothetical protein A2492_10460 [Ignavibacteria bacterium RIFOXYC12_FULL_35_11]OGU90706.1 MAG: hypothetical protein A3K31_15080 [Ignavibac
MKKKIFFLFAVLTLPGSPQTGDIDTLYYLHDTSHFIPNYAIAAEVFNIHTRFYPQQPWPAYRILELHLMLRPNKIGDTIQSISFYKDTLLQLIFTKTINAVLDSSNVFPNWFKIIFDDQTPITGVIEVPTWWGELCEVDPLQVSGNTIGFFDGSQSWGIFHDLPVKFIIQQIPVGVKENELHDFNFKLEQNYPNPFNPSTKIRYTIPLLGGARGGSVTLKVYDVLGNEVATLVDEYKPAGSYEVEFQSAVGNKQLASGIYFYQLKAGNFIETKKMLYLK